MQQKNIRRHWREFYLNTLTEKAVDINPYELIHKSIGQMDIKWIHIFDDDKEIIPYLFTFYNEEGLLEPEEGEEACSIEELYDGGDSQAAIHWMEILDARTVIKNNPDLEPCMHRPMYNIKGKNECYIIFNKEENKPALLRHFCECENTFTNYINSRSKDERKKELSALDTVIIAKFKSTKKYLRKDEDKNDEEEKDVIDEKEFEKYYYVPYTYETDGKELKLIQTQVTKEYIIQEFVKLLKADSREVAALAGIRELTDLSLTQTQSPKCGG